MTALDPVGSRRDAVPSTERPEAPRATAVDSYEPGFDGLKTFAMFAILLYHSELGWTPGAFLGLSQFFTLSGFLITTILLRSHDRGGIDLRRFWTRRFRRLMPAALACLALVMVFGATVADRDQAADLPGQILAAATYWVNWLFVFTKTTYAGLFASPSPVQHFWSLSVEEQFYVLLPLAMVLILRRTRSTAVLIAIFSGGMVLSAGWMAYLYGSGAGMDRVYYGTDTRMGEMLAGGLLAVVLMRTGLDFSERTRRILAVVGVAAFAATTWLMMTVPLADGPIWRGGMLPYSLLSCGLLLGVLCHRGPVASFYSWGPLPAIGRVTYGLYLYHWPIFLWLSPERTGLSALPLFGLRTGLTAALATLSYHFLEMPIRDGASLGLRGRWRLVLAPSVVVLLVGGTILTVDRSAPDPLATLRDGDQSLTPPILPSDGMLDILVVTDEKDPGVISRLQKVATSEGDARVVGRLSSACSGITRPQGRPICSNWAEQWPAEIAEHDPDVVVFYTLGWSDQEIGRLSGAGGKGLVPFAADVLSEGFDLLSARGAPIVEASPGASFATAIARSQQAFSKAILEVESRRTDLRRVLGGRLPAEDAVPRETFVRDSAAALLTDASLYQRDGGSGLAKVLILGDSQARSLGYGLERWAAQERKALVWNAATEGCGIAIDGVLRSATGDAPVASECTSAIAAFPKRVASFDPDVVIVLSSLWDLQTRKLPGWKTFHDPGDPAYDRYLVDAFTSAIDVFSANGAKVVWATAPCIDLEPGNRAATEIGATNNENFAHLNEVVLPAVVDARPNDVALFDLAAVLCPGGRSKNEIDGISPIRVDGAHFSVDGSLWFAATHGPELLRLGEH